MKNILFILTFSVAFLTGQAQVFNGKRYDPVPTPTNFSNLRAYEFSMDRDTFALSCNDTSKMTLYRGAIWVSYRDLTTGCAKWKLGGGGTGVWGAITGPISSQADLMAALNAKLNAPGGTSTQIILGNGALAPRLYFKGQLGVKIDSTLIPGSYILSFDTTTVPAQLVQLVQVGDMLRFVVNSVVISEVLNSPNGGGGTGGGSGGRGYVRSRGTGKQVLRRTIGDTVLYHNTFGPSPLLAIDSAADGTLSYRIIPGTNGYVITTVSGSPVWALPQNLATTDLSLTGNRKHRLVGRELQFADSANIDIDAFPDSVLTGSILYVWRNLFNGTGTPLIDEKIENRFSAAGAVFSLVDNLNPSNNSQTFIRGGTISTNSVAAGGVSLGGGKISGQTMNIITYGGSSPSTDSIAYTTLLSGNTMVYNGTGTRTIKLKYNVNVGTFFYILRDGSGTVTVEGNGSATCTEYGGGSAPYTLNQGQMVKVTCIAVGRWHLIRL